MALLGAILRLIGIRGFAGLAVGLALMAGWERLPWGLGPRLDRAEAASARKGAALVRAAGALRTAQRAIAKRDQAITDNAEGEAIDAGATANFWKGQCRAAFDAGYAARRCAAADASGDVRELRDVWGRGAWRAADRLPGEPGRADR